MKQIWVCYVLVIAILTGCKTTKPDIITYELSRSDFVEKIFTSGTLESANNFLIVAPTLNVSSVKVAWLVAEGSFVHQGDTICILESADLVTMLENCQKGLENIKADQAKLEANDAMQISNLQSQIAENRARMEMSQLDSIQIKFAPPVKQRIMELEGEKARITEQKLLKKLVSQKRINDQSIRALKSQTLQSEQMMQRFQEQIDKLHITAPKDGMLVYAESPYYEVIYSSGGTTAFGGNLKIGSTVRRNMALFNLPDLSDMQAVLMLQEADYKRIEKGQKVSIQPDAVEGLVTSGIVNNRAMVGQQLDYQSKIKSYKITVSVDSLDAQMLPGLSANCEIIVHQVNDTIVVPTMAIYERDSAKIIYVSKGDLFYPQKIETGLSNRSQTIVTSGLTGTETIALIEPPMNFIEKPKNSPDE